MTVSIFQKTFQYGGVRISTPKLRSLFRNFSNQAIRISSLELLHKQYKGRFINFAGWHMPVVYDGQSHVQSHHWTRNESSMFDVSHMQQVLVSGKDRKKFVESICVADVEAFADNYGGYSLITNDSGGVIDDTVVVNCVEDGKLEKSVINKDGVFMVVNAACAEKDIVHIEAKLKQFKALEGNPDVEVHFLNDRGLLALQGPKSASVLAPLVKGTDLSNLTFMSSTVAELSDFQIRITRCGYTGEDGFEISVPNDRIHQFAEEILSNPTVKLAGLAARDSLRLESGLCLYGNDLNEDTTPVEAGLMWTISKRRRTENAFPGADTILTQFTNKAANTKRIGLIQLEKGPAMRPGHLLFELESGEICGCVTSGMPSPTLGKNIAMAYVDNNPLLTRIGAEIGVKAKKSKTHVISQVVKMPFVAPKYYHVKK